MRRLRRLRFLSTSFLVALVAAALGTASASAGGRAILDERLQAIARSAASPTAEVRVIALGDGAGRARAAVGAPRRHRLSLVDGESFTVKVNELASVAGTPGIRHVVLDAPVVPAAASSPLSFPLLATLHPQLDGAPAAWSRGYTGAGVGIAIIDSGVEPIADFGTRLTRVQLSGQTSVTDVLGHGTYVASVAAGVGGAGRYVGIAPESSLVAVNVSGGDGTYTSDVVAGLDWVLANGAAHGVRVVNLSLSENVESSYATNILDTAVERLWRAGFVVVASSGNRGAGEISYAPANDPFVITVGAVDTKDTASSSDDVIATFSSSGQTLDGHAKPDVVAPGRRVVSALPLTSTLYGLAPLENLVAAGYVRMSGTSFAAPQVAGAAAVLLQQHPDWTPDQIKWLLMQTARSVSGSGAKAIDLAAATAFTGTPGTANAGLVASTYGLAGETSDPTGTWDGKSWNTAGWSGKSWNTAGWNTHVFD